MILIILGVYARIEQKMVDSSQLILLPSLLMSDSSSSVISDSSSGPTLQDGNFEDIAAVLECFSWDELVGSVSSALVSKQRCRIEKQESCAIFASSDANVLVLSTIQIQAVSSFWTLLTSDFCS